jgi:multidrug efflux pump subunit AcrA (membrane-fusion protein)
VVAEEVRSLAQRTAGATAEIQTLIARLQLAARQSVDGMRAQVEHAEATASQAQAADGALDEIVGAIQTIADTAVRIADVTAQQSGAVSEIRDHSERIHQLGGDNLLRIGQGREQGGCIPLCRPFGFNTQKLYEPLWRGSLLPLGCPAIVEPAYCFFRYTVLNGLGAAAQPRWGLWHGAGYGNL